MLDIRTVISLNIAAMDCTNISPLIPMTPSTLYFDLIYDKINETYILTSVKSLYETKDLGLFDCDSEAIKAAKEYLLSHSDRILRHLLYSLE